MRLVRLVRLMRLLRLLRLLHMVLLRLLRLLHLLRRHARHASHARHIREGRQLHRVLHGIVHAHRGLHGARRRVRSRQVRSGVVRVLGPVRRDGPLHGFGFD